MSIHTTDPPHEIAFDLLRVPVIGPLLRRRYVRRILQVVVLLIAVAMILHGFFGPRLAPRNLATLLTWVHFRGLLVIALLTAGNLFCMACPFTLARDVARRFFRPALNWPRQLRTKWLGIALFAAVLFVYELFDLWGSPVWTAWLIVGFFGTAVVVDSVFKNASFCKYVCPIGQFNFAASTLSPMEVAVRNPQVCASCTTLDCIRGRRDPADEAIVLQRGCELALFQPAKVGNMDCTFCLDCVYACPHDNVGITARLPGAELWNDERRSGVGRFSRRPDISILMLVFTFGALLNAFGMVSPVYAVQAWLGGLMGTTAEAPVLGALFLIVLILEPVLLVGAAAGLTKHLTGVRDGLLPLATRFAFALAPLGFGVWIAHYTFHLMTGLWTFVPVVQHLATPLFGQPDWTLTGVPEELVYPVQLGFLMLGLIISLVTVFRIARREFPDKFHVAGIPWAVLCVLLCAAAVWLLSQPMEMRGTFLGG
jgi:ferredoxin